MTEPQLNALTSLPGIKRDGTQLEGRNYTDGTWCRFQRGLPRKIGGYQELNNQLTGVQRAIYALSQQGYTYIHGGSATKLERLSIENATGVTTGVVDRTPAGFTTDTNNMWQIAELFSAASSDIAILAHAAPYAVAIDDETVRPVYFGNHTATAALAACVNVGPATTGVEGGICVSPPYAWAFGANGYAQWSPPNVITDWVGAGGNNARIASSKIVKGVALRSGGGQSPAVLFWSLDALVRATFVGGTTIFNFDTISGQSSILSPATVIEYDGVYYWLGVDRPLSFNGVVREVPNQLNLNYLYDNFNWNARCKAHAFKVPRWGEIWWCLPLFGATEPNWAIVYNVREGTWYDTALPEGGRSAGFYAQVYRYPLAASVNLSGGKSSLWQHEVGKDKQIVGGARSAIRSYFTTGDISLATPSDGGAGKNKGIKIPVVEPDFVQIGAMTCSILTRANARAPVVVGESVSFPAAAATADEQVIKFQGADQAAIGRQVRFQFESNVAGGDYETGLPIAWVQESGRRFTS